MHMHADHARLQMSACRALRNMVVRNSELQGAILAEAAEHYINLASEALARRHP